MMTPPEVFSLPVILCPSCEHGIDPHGFDPGGFCGVGDDKGIECMCLWSPNDIAAQILVDLHAKVEALEPDGQLIWRDDVLALLDGGSE